MTFLSKLFGSLKQVTPTAVRTVASFETEVLQSSCPVVVDVWSPSCGPCQKLAPVLIEVATRYEGRVKVVEISADSEPALLERLQVRATPTIIVFEEGSELGRQAGYRPREWFDQMIEAEFPPT